MANSNQGDGRSVNWTHFLSPSLPPKSPSGSSAADAAGGFFSGRSSNGSSSSATKIHHQRTPSAGFVPQITTPSSWIDDMLDSPEAPARKIHHRRSSSDTAAFLDVPVVDHHPRIPVDHHDFSSYSRMTTARPPDDVFERLDDAEHIATMFVSDGEQRSRAGQSSPLAGNGSNGIGAAGSNGNGMHCFERKQSHLSHHPETTSSPSDSNSGNDMSIEENRSSGLSVPKIEHDEVQSSDVVDHDQAGSRSKVLGSRSAAGGGSGKQPTASTHIDPSMDPKRAKRILANRQSAQRSRVRKLQYIAELERSVTALQTEVSALTPQVAFLDHQRILLNVDNNSIKQRITSLMQDKRFKDAQNEALTRELHRLRQMVLQQQEELRSQLQQFNAGDSDDLHDTKPDLSSSPSSTIKLHEQPCDLSANSSSTPTNSSFLREIEN